MDMRRKPKAQRQRTPETGPTSNEQIVFVCLIV